MPRYRVEFKFVTHPKTLKLERWIKLIPFGGGQTKIEFIEVLAIGIEHVAQAALKLEAQRFVKSNLSQSHLHID